MADPTIDETRAGARVVVYGDSAPITAQEWHCARLAHAIFGVAVTIRREGVWSLTVDATDAFFLYVRPDRAAVVEVCAAKFREIAQRYIAGTRRRDKRAARLRAPRRCAVTRGDLCSPLAAMLCARDRARRSGDGVRLRALAWHVAALHGAALTLCAMVANDCAAWAATEGV